MHWDFIELVAFGTEIPEGLVHLLQVSQRDIYRVLPLRGLT